MSENKRILKYFSIPVLFIFLVLGPTSYFTWKEYSINNEITEQALSGNQIAVQILIKYEKPWKLDRRILREAMEGNENAIKILGVNNENKVYMN